MQRKRKALENSFKVLLIQADVHSELEPTYKVKKISTAKPLVKSKKSDQGDLDFIQTVKDFEETKVQNKMSKKQVENIVNSDSEQSYEDVLRQSKKQMELQYRDKRNVTAKRCLRLKTIDNLSETDFEDIDFSNITNRKKLQRQTKDIISSSDSESLEDIFDFPNTRLDKNVTKLLDYSPIEIEDFCNILSSTKDEVTAEEKHVETTDLSLKTDTKKKNSVDEDLCNLLSSTKDELSKEKKHIKAADLQLKTDASTRKKIVESHSSEDFFEELFSNTKANVRGGRIKEEVTRNRGKKNTKTGCKSPKQLFEIGLSLLVDALPLIQKLSKKYNCKDELRKLKEALNTIEE